MYGLEWSEAGKGGFLVGVRGGTILDVELVVHGDDLSLRIP